MFGGDSLDVADAFVSSDKVIYENNNVYIDDGLSGTFSDDGTIFSFASGDPFILDKEEKNGYGFYYNRKYTGIMSSDNSECSVIFYSDGTAASFKDGKLQSSIDSEFLNIENNNVYWDDWLIGTFNDNGDVFYEAGGMILYLENSWKSSVQVDSEYRKESGENEEILVFNSDKSVDLISPSGVTSIPADELTYSYNTVYHNGVFWGIFSDKGVYFLDKDLNRYSSFRRQ